MRWVLLLGCLATIGALPARAADPAVIVLLGTGTQVYGCAQAGTGFTWKLEAPDGESAAILPARAGKPRMAAR